MNSDPFEVAPYLLTMSDIDKVFMQFALEQAAEAELNLEVPVGACIVDAEGNVVAAASNRTITDIDPTGHAEIIALRMAAKAVGNYRLTEMTLYSTIEPCAMCAGALVNARIKRLVYGADDLRYGAVRTHFGICDSDLLNHRMEITSGVLADECSALIKRFFKARRK